MSILCAICVDEIHDDPPRREPLGKGGALVFICDDCATEEPGTAPAPSAAMEASPMRSRTQGWLLVRVARRDAHGVSRDVNDAYATLRDRPYAKELRLLGMSSHHVCFERPDPSARGLRESVNPLAWLSQYKTEPTS